ncbi:solute carrier family 25 member 40-like protein [Dinothrombium tinctorium]|uniref:Solute carrier family 25 member 40-like protein n=1 Tax=Dinothrombium tinctorium TaxID=1965070 RepID=A0A443R9A1_9ACAR|nr:solute carrier family 25 member 40-like protein [Dinothrombium tinctorium]
MNSESNAERIARETITPMQQMISSCTGAIVTSIFVTPLDVVKIRIQAQQKEFLKNKCFLYCNGLMDHICYCNGNGNGANGMQKTYPPSALDLRSSKWFKRPVYFRGTMDGIYKIARTEGITSLWSGLPPTLYLKTHCKITISKFMFYFHRVMAIPATVVYFTTYDQLKDRLSSWFQLSNQPFWLPIVAGSSSRLFAATLISPLEMIRTKMQSKKLSYFEVGQAVKTLVKIEGKLALWRGLGPSLLRDVPFSAIYWTGYETIKARFQVKEPSFKFSFVAGAFSGTIAAIATLPFDVVKTHRQIELGEEMLKDKRSPAEKSQKRTLSIMKKIYVQRGVAGLFAGLSPRIIKVAPACAIMISTYECGKKFFRYYNTTRTQ